MVVALAVFQPPIGWLKLEAAKNVDCMSTTLAVFQETMLTLKAYA